MVLSPCHAVKQGLAQHLFASSLLDDRLSPRVCSGHSIPFSGKGKQAPCITEFILLSDHLSSHTGGLWVSVSGFFFSVSLPLLGFAGT